MHIDFIENTNGLKPEHQGITPLLEKLYRPPGRQNLEVTRVYRDGGLYFFFENRAAPDSAGWAYLTVVKDKGLNELHSIFDKVCDLKGEPPASGGGEGEMTIRFDTGRCRREIVVYGIDYGEFRELDKISDAINLNLVPVTLPGQ